MCTSNVDNTIVTTKFNVTELMYTTKKTADIIDNENYQSAVFTIIIFIVKDEKCTQSRVLLLETAILVS